MNNSDIELQPLCVATSPPRGVRRLGDNNSVTEARDVVKDVLDDEGRCSEVIYGTVEESLDLLVVQIHRYQMVYP